MKKLLLLSLWATCLPALAAEPAMDHSGMAGMDMSAMPGMKMAMPKATPKPAAKTKPKLATKPATKPASKPAPSAKPQVHPVTPHRHPDQSKPTAMSKMDHSTMNMASDTMDMSKGSMDMAHMDHGAMEMGKNATTMPTMDHGSMTQGTMKMGPMQGGSAPADARDPDYSQGRDFGPIAPPHMMGNGVMTSIRVNQLEVSHRADQTRGGYDLEAWVGTDWNRAVLKAEGEIAHHKLTDARTELLWRRPVDAFWNGELGIRQDSGSGPDRTWLALGVNGISPYWLELGATVYVGDNSRAALRLEATYDWRLTQRLILQPTLETNLYSKDDPARDIGQGLSDLQAGLRLRYEITRQFAPYIGVETQQQYGKTAELRRADNEPTHQTTALAGVRLWF